MWQHAPIFMLNIPILPMAFLTFAEAKVGKLGRPLPLSKSIIFQIIKERLVYATFINGLPPLVVVYLV